MYAELKENHPHGTREYPFCEYHMRYWPHAFQIPVHWHDEVEIIYVRKGPLMVEIDGQKFIGDDGAVYIVSPGVLHMMTAPETPVDYFTFLFPMEFISFQTKDELDDEILDYIATNIKSNIRELEGALNKLLAYSNLEHKQITMEVAIEELQNIISPDKPKEITPQLIIDVVCEHFGITLDQIKSKSRSNDIAKPRQIAMYLSKNMTDASLDSIGSLLGGRDHSTIIHGINKITDEYESNENIHNSIDTIKKKINPN